MVKLTFTKLPTKVLTEGSISRLLNIFRTSLFSKFITNRPTKKTIRALIIVKPNWEPCSTKDLIASSNLELASAAANNTISLLF